MATFRGIGIVLLFTCTVCVHSFKHGWRPPSDHDQDHRPGHRDESYPDHRPALPRPGDDDCEEPSDPEEETKSREDDDEDHDKAKSSLPYIIGMGLVCVGLIVVVVGLAVYTVKKKKLHNKISSDPRKTPVVSVINYPPPDYTPHKTFRTSKLPDVTGTALPYEPSKGSLRNPLPPVEGTVPPAQPPAYNSLSPTSPPPPYEI